MYSVLFDIKQNFIERIFDSIHSRIFYPLIISVFTTEIDTAVRYVVWVQKKKIKILCKTAQIIDSIRIYISALQSS